MQMFSAKGGLIFSFELTEKKLLIFASGAFKKLYECYASYMCL